MKLSYMSDEFYSSGMVNELYIDSSKAKVGRNKLISVGHIPTRYDSSEVTMINRQIKGIGYIYAGDEELKTIPIAKSDWYRTTMSSFRPLYSLESKLVSSSKPELGSVQGLLAKELENMKRRSEDFIALPLDRHDPHELVKHINVKMVCGERVRDDEMDYIEILRVEEWAYANGSVQKTILFKGRDSETCPIDFISSQKSKNA